MSKGLIKQRWQMLTSSAILSIHPIFKDERNIAPIGEAQNRPLIPIQGAGIFDDHASAFDALHTAATLLRNFYALQDNNTEMLFYRHHALTEGISIKIMKDEYHITNQWGVVAVLAIIPFG